MEKGYQVIDVQRNKRIGVLAGNRAELMQKSCVKLGFNVEWSECQLYVAEEGTLVGDDEYLATLPAQTLFVLLKDDEQMVTDSELAAVSDISAVRPRVDSHRLKEILEAMDFDETYELIIQTLHQKYINAGTRSNKFVISNMKKVIKEFKIILDQADDSKTMLSKRSEHPEWFEGVHRLEKTKEQSMSKRVKVRMNNYYNETATTLRSSDIYKNSPHGKQLITQFLKNLRKFLVLNNYNESYFNRKAAQGTRLCLDNGTFECGGLWNQAQCSYGDHVVNPYRNQHDRMLFSIWNLDHKNERSRSIIPMIVKAVECLCRNDFDCITCNTRGGGAGGVEPFRYYLQIFTKVNLKLVHYVCHDKKKRVGSDVGTYALCKNCMARTP